MGASKRQANAPDPVPIQLYWPSPQQDHCPWYCPPYLPLGPGLWPTGEGAGEVMPKKNDYRPSGKANCRLVSPLLLAQALQGLLWGPQPADNFQNRCWGHREEGRGSQKAFVFFSSQVNDILLHKITVVSMIIYLALSIFQAPYICSLV